MITFWVQNSKHFDEMNKLRWCDITSESTLKRKPLTNTTHTASVDTYTICFGGGGGVWQTYSPAAFLKNVDW